ncbi:GNAT family N-acetyltransferase [Robertkochia solimangrovi]|nr:GNAT family N-acetyltransferase [Robertkochia solimangrovi]TRZ46473.1 GNAT family N-acetyltransferase [Robertkochia solimangrovi]
MVRIALTKEIDRLLEIARACDRHMRTKGIIQWTDNYPSKEAFLKDIEREELYVLEDNNIIIGCVVISKLKDEFYNEIEWLTPDKNNYYIHRLAVHPDFQKMGHAQRMMSFAESLARENDAASVRLDTFSKNQGNMRFYEQRGYQRLAPVYFPQQSEHPFHCYELVLQSSE